MRKFKTSLTLTIDATSPEDAVAKFASLEIDSSDFVFEVTDDEGITRAVMSALAEPIIDDPVLDKRFGAHGYECLALWQHDDRYLGYVWVPHSHPYNYVSDIAPMPYVMAKVNYSDIRCGRKCTTLRLNVNAKGEALFDDLLACIAALDDCAKSLRAMADRSPNSHEAVQGNTWAD